MTITSEGIVSAAMGEALCRRIGLPRFQLWFHDKTKLVCRDDVLVVGVPNHFYQEWLEKTFVEDVRQVGREVLGQTLPVKFVIDPELFQAARQKEAEALATTNFVAGALGSQEAASQVATPWLVRGTGPATVRERVSARRWRSLDDFVVGPCNRVAHASALALVETPQECPSPLVLHGPVGTGKSHLLEGIWSGLRKHQPHWRVCFVTAEEFTNRFLGSMRQNKLASFRKHFRDCDALLLDDLNFLSNKAATQEEFLHTLNELQTRERPLAVTCDCHPRLGDAFMPELTDRLMGGAVWGLALPDRQTRLDLLRAKAGQFSFSLAEEIVVFLADQLTGNVRELEGALHSIRHHGRVAGKPIDLVLARAAVADLIRHNVRVVKLAEVEQAVASVLGLERGDLQSKKRGWRFSHPRMLAMFLARKHTRATYAEIGQHFGGRNHSTTVAAEKKVRQWLKEDTCLTLGSRQLPVRDVVERVERAMDG